MFTRPPGFIYEGEDLLCEGLRVSSLANKFGTPLYIYSSAAIRERFALLDRAFRGTPHTLCYSIKANSNLSILRLLAGLNAGFDIVSGGELERVRLARRKALAKVVFSGVGKTANELEQALKAGILLFNVESEGELEVLAARALRLRKTANVALRVNPDVPAETHPYISTGLREHKFGVSIHRARRLYEKIAASRYLKVAGVSLHIGSQITDVAPFQLAVERAVELVNQLSADGHKIQFLDAGGGLGISYDSTRAVDYAETAQRYAEAITGPLKKLGKRRPHLLLEPGRFIIAQAGALITHVLYLKENGSKRFTIVDAAMNDLIRPSLYGARHEIVPVRLSDRQEPSQADIAGPVCESGDFLARDAIIQQPRANDYLCVYDAGAYGMSLASNYNTRMRAAEVLVDGRKARLIRHREILKDVLRSETECL